MLSQISPALLTFEAIQVAVCLCCLAIAVRTLNEARATRRHVLASGRNHGAQIWSRINVRGKACFVVIQLLLALMGVDRVALLCAGYAPELPLRWLCYGAARSLIGVLIAATAWANMMAYRRLRDE